MLRDYFNRYILITKLAGHSGDIFAIKQQERVSVDELLAALVLSLDDSQFAATQDGTARVRIITSGTYMESSDLHTLEKYASHLSLTISIDVGHHNGSHLCKHSVSSISEMLSWEHASQCAYYHKLKVKIDQASSVLGDQVFINSYGNEEDETNRSSLATAFQLPLEQVLLGTVYNPHIDSTSYRSSADSYNTHLIFVEKRQQLLYGFFAFRNLLLGLPDEKLSESLQNST